MVGLVLVVRLRLVLVRMIESLSVRRVVPAFRSRLKAGFAWGSAPARAGPQAARRTGARMGEDSRRRAPVPAAFPVLCVNEKRG